MALAILPIAVGCAQQAASSPPLVTNTAAVAETDTTPVVPVATTNNPVSTNASGLAEMPQIDLTTAEAKPVSDPKPVPVAIRPSGPMNEIVKLANSGVGDSVMLAYVTNATSAFGLGAEEIIYLKDIGVPDEVVTAMIQRDQQLRDSGVVAAPLNSNATSNWIAAPQPQQAQRPEDVAPQATAPPAGENPQPAPPPPETVVNYNTFYDSLSPYGTWYQVDGYGYIWRPSVVTVNPGWRPYYDNGRWVYTDAGWYWYSDYSWGWAPFHYGRWFNHHRYGWCWAPDYVWGPSWVTWRYTGDYCGWAPLPPSAWWMPGFGLTYYGSSFSVGFGFGLGWNAYCFVPYNDFHHHHHHYAHYRMSRDLHMRVYNSSVVATRIEGNRTRVINNGLPPDRIRAATGTDVRRVSLRETTTAPTGGVRAERLEANGRTLTVHRPEVRQTSTTATATTSRTPGTVSGTRTSRNDPAFATFSGSGSGSGSTTTTRTERSGMRTAPTRSTTIESPSVSSRGDRPGSPAVTSRSTGGSSSGTVRSAPSSPRTPRDLGNRSGGGGRGSGRQSSIDSGTSAGVAQNSAGPSTVAPSANSAPSAPTVASAPTANQSVTRSTGPGRSLDNNRSARSLETTRSQGRSAEVPRYAPSASPYAPVQTRPSVTAPAQNSAQASTPSTPSYTAPTGARSYSAPTGARSYTPPTGARTYSPPTGAQTYSPPTGARSYSPPAASPAPTYTPPARSYSAPSYTPRSYSAPSTPSYSAPSRSTPSPSYSAPSRSTPSPSYSAPSRSYSAPSAPSAPSSRSYGGGDSPRSYGGGGGRGDRR